MPDSLADLGVRLTPNGGQLRVWSESATSMELVLFDDKDASWVTSVVPMAKDEASVWSVETELLVPGTRYSFRVLAKNTLGNSAPSNVVNAVPR